MKKRLLASLLVLVMVVGLLPSTAFASSGTGGGDTDSGVTDSGDVSVMDLGQYSVRFRQDAANSTEIAVYAVSSDGTPLDINTSVTPVTLDGVTFNLESVENGAILIDNLVSGYGLLSVRGTDGTDYFFNTATWGSAGSATGSDSISTITYEDVTTNQAQGIYLWYNTEAEQTIPVQMVSRVVQSGGNQDAPIGSVSTMASGIVDNAKAQGALSEAGIATTYAFLHAELRPVDDSVSSVDAIAVESIRRVNGYYMVTSTDTTNTYDYFDVSSWEVYLVFTPAYRVTITVNNVRTDTTIDGEQIPKSDTGTNVPTETVYTYQIPQNGTLSVEFILGQRANMRVVNTTGGEETVLFDSARAQDGFQTKLWTLEMSGDDVSQDQTITVNITRSDTAYNPSNGSGVGTGYRLEYSDYLSNNSEAQRWHNSDIRIVNNGSAWNAVGTSLKNTANGQYTINEGQALRFYGGNQGSEAMFPNSIVINGVSIPLSFEISWTKPSDVTGDTPYRYQQRSTFTAYFDVVTATQVGTDPRMMFQVEVWTCVRWNRLSEGIRPTESFVELRFIELYNGISITSGNLGANNNQRTIILDEIDTGLTGRDSDDRTLMPGSGVDVEGANSSSQASLVVTPEFGYYVDDVIITSASNAALQKPGNAASNWWGTVNYWFNTNSTAGADGRYNGGLIDGRERGVVNSETINFQLRYHMDNQQDSSFVYLDPQQFLLTGASTTDDGTEITQYTNTPALIDVPLRVPEGQMFLGWSVIRNADENDPRYGIGEVIPRSVIMSNPDCVEYTSTVGQAVIDLYPVFVPIDPETFTSYAVVLHIGDNIQTHLFSDIPTGSLILRESVLATDTISNIVNQLPANYALDGGRSDSRITATNELVTFNLYYYDTNSVDITFISDYGFVDVQTPGEYTEETRSFTPGDVMPTNQIPVPYEQDVGATFIGWSRLGTDDLAGATQMTSLANATAPYQATTYYAVYAEDVTLTFFNYNGINWDGEEPHTITLPYNTSVTEDQLQQLTMWRGSVNGYTFSHWSQTSLFGVEIRDTQLTTTRFTADTIFYGIYTPVQDINITLNANGSGAYFPSSPDTGAGNSTLQMSNLTFGESITANSQYRQPVRPGYIFVGWSEHNNADVGNATITAGTDVTTYYAVWISPELQVEIVGNDEYVFDGTAKTPTLRVTYAGEEILAGNGTTGYQVNWGDNINAGDVFATVTYQGHTGYATFRIERANISAIAEIVETATWDEIQLQNTGTQLLFTGSPIHPTVTVTDSRTGVVNGGANPHVLDPYVDYQVSYGTNTAVGGGTVSIMGLGNYQGEATFNFSIVNTGADNGGENNRIEIAFAEIPDQIYNSGNMPTNFSYVVYDRTNNRILRVDEDFRINLPTDGNWNIGQVDLTATGIGDYQNLNAQTSFQIRGMSQSLTVRVTPDVITGSAQNPTITVSGPEGNLTESDYTLTYRYLSGDQWGSDTDFTLAQISTALARPGMYVITANGRNGYDGASGSATFVRNDLTSGSGGLNVSFADLEGNGVFDYTGANYWDQVQAALQVTVGADSAEVPSYTINVSGPNSGSWSGTYSGSAYNWGGNPPSVVNAGTYTITVESNDVMSDGSTGTAYVYVNQRNIADVTLSGLTSTVEYGQINAQPTVTLTDEGLDPSAGDGVLTPGVGNDYTLSWNTSSFGSVGTKVITIQGIGNYYGNQVATYTVTPKTITIGAPTDNQPNTADSDDWDELFLTYGYSRDDVNEALTGLAEYIQAQAVNGDSITPHLYVDDSLSVNYWPDEPRNGAPHIHLHGDLTGDNADSYRLVFQTEVWVSPLDLNDPGTEHTVRVQANPDNHGYNGSPHTPEIQVHVDNRLLMENTDFRVTQISFQGPDDGSSSVVYTWSSGQWQNAEGNNDWTNTPKGMTAIGTYTITVTGIGSYQGQVATAEFRVTSNETPTVSVEIDLAAQEQIYTGQEITLPNTALTIMTGDEEVTLPNDNIRLIYSDNLNAGQATVTVFYTLSGGGTAIGSAEFEILPKDISVEQDTDNEIQVTGYEQDATFTGDPIEPQITVTYSPASVSGHTNTLRQPGDISVSYGDNTQAGTNAGTITITAAPGGNYTGTRIIQFNIVHVPVDLTFQSWDPENGYNNRIQETVEGIVLGQTIRDFGNGKEDSITALAGDIPGYRFVGWAEGSPLASTNQTADLMQRANFNADATFYAVYAPLANISITLDPNGGTYNGQTTATTVDSLTFGTTYTPSTPTRTDYTFAGWSTTNAAAVGSMDITVPATSQTYYAIWLSNDIALDVEVSYNAGTDGRFVYNGLEQLPTITVTDRNGNPLDDVTVANVQWDSGSDRTSAGTHTGVVIHDGYRGLVVYTIDPRPITTSAAVALGSTSVAYNGQPQRPNVTVTDSGLPAGDQALVLGVDYSVAYGNNLNVADSPVTVTVTGHGNFTGSTRTTFTITPYTGTLHVAPIENQAFQNGADVNLDKADLVVYDDHGNVLADSDYELSYDGAHSAIGQANIIVTGAAGGNYAGATGNGSFQIVGPDGTGSGLTVTVNPPQAAYNEGGPDVTVRLGELALNEDNGDYTLSFAQFVNGVWSTAGVTEDSLAQPGMYRITATGNNVYASAGSGSAIFVRTPANTSEGGSGDETGDIQYTGLNVGGSAGLIFNGQDRLNDVLGSLRVTSGGTPAADLTLGQDYQIYVNNTQVTQQDGVYTGAAMTNAGAYTIEIQGISGYANSSVSTTVYIQPKDINNDTVTVVDEGGSSIVYTAEYTGTLQQPTIRLRDTEYDRMTVSTDYRVEYDARDFIDADTYVITVEGTGNYTGIKTLAYTITPVEITYNDDVELDYGYASVSRQVVLEAVEHGIVDGDNVALNLYLPYGLDAGVHSDVTQGYLTGPDAGNYTLSLGSQVLVNKTSTIDPGEGGSGDAPNSDFRFWASPDSMEATGGVVSPEYYITHNNVMLEIGADADAADADFYISSIVMVGDQSNTNLVNTGMIAPGTYTITATATTEGNFTGELTTTFAVIPATSGGGLTVEVLGTHTYTGEAITLTGADLRVMFNSTELQEGTEYVIVGHERNTVRGTATVNIEGRGAYLGRTGSANFEIQPKSIGTGTATPADTIEVSGVEDSYTYQNRPIQPVPTIRDTARGVDLQRNSDYTVEYGENTSGTGTVTITGTANYTGSVVLTFTINRGDRFTVSGVEQAYTYTGTPIEPELTVRDSNGTLLEEGVHYTVQYGDNLNVGIDAGSVTVIGRGVYSGVQQTVAFDIVAKLLNLDVTVTPNSAVYNSATEVAIDVALDGESLTLTDHYTLYYQKYGEDGQLGPQTSFTDPSDLMQEAGVYVITANGAAGGAYEGALGSATFVCLPDDQGGGGLVPGGGQDEEGNPITGSNNLITLTYDGSNHISVLDDIVIYRAEDGTATDEEVDCNRTITFTGVGTYTEGQMVNSGLYTITYTPTDPSITGNAFVFVIINPKSILDGDIRVNGLGASDYTYTGEEQMANIQVIDDGINTGTELDVNVDYNTLSGESVSQTNAGSYNILITGIGNYVGTRQEIFIINEAPITVTQVRDPIEYTYGYDGPIALETPADYTIEGIMANDAGNGNVTVTLEIPDGLDAGDHFIQPVLGGASAQNYTITGGVTVIVNPIDITDPDGDGEPGVDEDDNDEPDPNPDKGDEDGDGVVDPDGDEDGDGFIEDVEDENGDKDGVIETVSGFRVEMSPVSQPFNSQPHNPTITVTYQPDENAPGTELQRDTDYTVTYWNSDGEQVTEMIAVGEYTVRVTMTGNYQGGFDLTYTITPPDPTPGEGGEGGDGGDGDTDNDGNIEDGDGDHEITWGGFHVTMVPYSAVHNGQAHHPRVTVTYMSDGGTATTLQEQQDYNVGYYDSEGNLVPEMIDVGTYTVRVTGVGNYDGFVFELDFTITQQTGGGGIIVPDPEPEGPEVADPDDTGVSDWLDTDNHNAYLQGYGNNLFVPNANMSRAEVAQMFYNLLRNKDVAITVSFDDVPAGSWYAEAVNTLASLGMIKGAGDGRFYPNSPITRAEFIAIAMRFANGGEITGEVSFTDVNPDSWYYESVVGAVQYGWIIGYGNGLFAPNASITRAEVTTIANRMLGRSADEAYVNSHLGELKQFTDVAGWSFYQIVEATNSHTYTMSNGKETWTGLK